MGQSNGVGVGLAHTALSSSCTHTIPSSLAPELPEPKFCPMCIVEQHICTIQDVQREFASRGGTFKSKEDDHWKHKKIRKVWRDAKIALMNTVAKFEEMVQKKDVPAQDLGKLSEALGVWESKQAVLSRVPGVQYFDGAEEAEPSEEDEEIARLMMQLLRMVLERELSGEDMTPVTKTTLTTPKQKELPSKPLFAAPATPGPTSTPHAEAQQAPVAILAPSTSKPPAQQKPTPPKSILKRPHATTSPNTSPTTSPQRKRVRTLSFATISSPALNTTNPSPFARLSNATTTQPHAPHTHAENQRRRTHYHRTSAPYAPGVWASGAFSEKANTSFRTMEAGVMDSAVEEELVEERREREVAEGLKIITGAWILGCWVRKVGGKVDLGRLVEEMERRMGK
ncbi:hypothetical protein EJ02DRAFT_452291 [Clathrospora elynae]|uniref:Uncharacterized protein n=1 Tax=Clathrospora elynae TaxID=706981 RepID=A0A6A5SZ90_9PLEO|nr:hypothetical protein EJ02DRAFT_452291 [Clathrospora elynae]